MMTIGELVNSLSGYEQSMQVAIIVKAGKAVHVEDPDKLVDCRLKDGTKYLEISTSVPDCLIYANESTPATR